MRRSRARSPVRSLRRRRVPARTEEPWLAARPRFRSAVVIAVSLAKPGSPGFGGGVRASSRLRSISSSTLQVAYAVVAPRLGSASQMGPVLVSPVGKFVRDLSVQGPSCRRKSAVEMALAVGDSAGGTPLAVQSARSPVRAGAGCLMSGLRRISTSIDRESPAASVSDSRQIKASALPSPGATAFRCGFRVPSQVARLFTIFP